MSELGQERSFSLVRKRVRFAPVNGHSLHCSKESEMCQQRTFLDSPILILIAFRY